MTNSPLLALARLDITWRAVSIDPCRNPVVVVIIRIRMGVPDGDGGEGVTGVCGADDELDPHPPTRASAAAISSRRPDDTVHYQAGAKEPLTIRYGSHEICN